ncbi:MAG TPA: glycosyltransferase family 4 protein [Acidobacteriaceae bacterium]|nr:glycosyltransferase family 4 protein [Acidobacteriaceae bacterium]
MQVVQAVCGTFWHFDLANELEARGYLKRIYSSFPWIRLKREGVPRAKVSTFPWIHGPLMASGKFISLPKWVTREIMVGNFRSFDAWVASRIEECDVFVALSGVGLKSGSVAKRRGARYVCDRGSSHIRYQKTILEEEYARWGIRDERVDPRIVDREEAEYAEADAIAVPSEFARRSFVEMGVPAEKVWKIPYGVRLDRFKQTGEPETGRFDVLFAGTVSIRKGVPYLLQAFAKLKHPNKRLRLAGPVEREMSSLFPQFDMSYVEVLGRQTQAELAQLMSRSHTMVLPSIEDGFGLVMAQAMACGTVVVSSANTGGPDLYSDGVEGFVVPIRSPEAITERLEKLAGDPDIHAKMRDATLKRVRNLGGWHSYGEGFADMLRHLTHSGTPNTL